MGTLDRLMRAWFKKKWPNNLNEKIEMPVCPYHMHFLTSSIYRTQLCHFLNSGIEMYIFLEQAFS